ncbi:MAG: DUF169 domain-containing protein [Candidatus Krumholzibacteria bacterium]|nr:DUF169 domain-containing protein [Candidatus Krumholzibacteria bacterium]
MRERKNAMQPYPDRLVKTAGIEIPLIGFYDAPDPAPFAPVVEPRAGTRVCVFAFYKNWLKGETLRVTKDNFGCGGAGRSWCGVEERSREEFIHFLVDEEGLKASRELMSRWIDSNAPYRQKHPNILVGPLRETQYEFLKTVTFFVNPDQLGLMTLGAQYESAPEDAPPVISPFGSGCMQLVGVFKDLGAPQAAIGGTDMAMRQYLPPDILAFTVTKSMYERLASLDERSFLSKPFWKRLMKARKKG